MINCRVETIKRPGERLEGSHARAQPRTTTQHSVGRSPSSIHQAGIHKQSPPHLLRRAPQVLGVIVTLSASTPGVARTPHPRFRHTRCRNSTPPVPRHHAKSCRSSTSDNPARLLIPLYLSPELPSPRGDPQCCLGQRQRLTNPRLKVLRTSLSSRDPPTPTATPTRR